MFAYRRRSRSRTRFRRFKQTCEGSGAPADIRRHQHFEKPLKRRKRKLDTTKRKVRRMARLQER